MPKLGFLQFPPENCAFGLPQKRHLERPTFAPNESRRFEEVVEHPPTTLSSLRVSCILPKFSFEPTSPIDFPLPQEKLLVSVLPTILPLYLPLCTQRQTRVLSEEEEEEEEEEERGLLRLLPKRYTPL